MATHRYKKGTIRTQYYECGIEVGMQFAINYLMKKMGSSYELEKETISSDIMISEFEKYKNKYLITKQPISKNKHVVDKFKKRGRKRKYNIDPKINDSQHVALWEELCEGKPILIDCLNNAFTYDMENPKYLGEYTLEGKIDSSIPYTLPPSNFIRKSIDGHAFAPIDNTKDIT